jgi:hypothetical protein
MLKVVFDLVLLTIIICSSLLAQADSISANIRYEHISNNGLITNSLFIKDPMQSQYGTSPLALAPNTFKVRSLNADKNRIQVVYVGDGYTKEEIQQYRDDVQTQIQALLEQEPFKTYKNYFAFHIIEAISEESGVSNSSSELKKTAFGMYYNCGGIDRLLCINLSKLSQALSQAPKADIVFALANSEKYGGAGYLSPAVATLAARNKSSTELAFHEIGHSFGKLIDEYDNTDGSANCNSYPNVSSVDHHEMLAKKIKWFRWLDQSHISTFKGACYSQNFYRPTENSKMRSLKRPFEEVNVEQLAKRIYEKLRLTEEVKSEKAENGHVKVRATLMKPVGHNLQISWYLNDTEIPATRNQTEIDTNTLGLNTEVSTLKLKIEDLTQMVRDEEFRKKYMTETYRWNLQIKDESKLN